MYFNLCFYGNISEIIIPLCMIENIIVCHYKGNFETFGSLKTLCKVKKWSYYYLRNKKLPIKYKGIDIVKTPFNHNNGI